MKSKIMCISSVLLCFALLLGCAACASESGSGGTSTATSSEKSSTALSSKETSSEGLTSRQLEAASRAASEAFAKKTKISIMPMGDSLTDGYEHNQMGAYRSFLNNMIAADNYNYTFVGAHNWESRLITNGNVMHSGWGGIDVPGLNGKLEEIQKNAKPAPDIILLMIGRNDVTAGKSAEKTVENIDTLLVGPLYEMYPNTTIMLASPPPVLRGTSFNLTDPGITTYAAAYKAYVEKKKGEGCKMEYVDMGIEATGLTYEDFKNEEGAVDSVHPYMSGFEKIAKTWYNSLKPVMDKIFEEKSKES